MNAYEEGQQTYFDGKWVEDNPHPEGSSVRAKWDEGYFHADIQKSGETS